MNDDGKRQCLVAYLRNPASGGFPSEALSDKTGGETAAGRRRRFGECARPPAALPPLGRSSPLRLEPLRHLPLLLANERPRA
eukprot:85855-Pyramimonas_sp.AAC.1